MKKDKKNILIILGLSLIACLFFFSITKGITTTIETQYPEFETGEKITPETTLPEYIKYIFKFSFIIVGILAFAFLIYGGVCYLTSTGNPTVMKDAKDRIFSAILGLIILLCSYLILINLNPELITIEMEKLEPVTGIYLISAISEENKIYYSQSVSNIPEGFNRVQFISPSEELISVFAFPETFFRGDAQEIKNNGASTLNSLPANTKSIRFKWDLPGVYLKGEKSGEEIRLVGNISDLGVYYFKGKTKEIELKDLEKDSKKITNYQAIIHENRDFEGACQVFTESDNTKIKNFSSVTVFQRKEVSSGEEVEIILYPLPNYQEYEGNEEAGKEPIEKQTYSGEQVSPIEIGDLENNVRSIITPPGYLVILFEKGPSGTSPWVPLGSKCQVFTRNNPNLTNEPIGKCGGVSILGTDQWNFEPCATYIAIFAVK